MELTEEQIILGCKNGKRKARNKLYKLYANKLLGISLRYTRNKSEAEDVLHDAFIKIFTKIDQYSGKGSFEAWMKRIVSNTAIQHLRDRAKERLIINSNEIDEDSMADIQEDEIPSIPPKELLRLIQGLPDGYRIIFNMYIFEEMSHQEIASELGIKEGTSKSQLHRAKNQLRNEVNEYMLSTNK